MFPLPALTAWHFALAGLVCAAGPVIIHLLNRRRFRVVQWAAMDFLREAIQRNRRILQLRDILLLLLRTAAVLLFGLALARPYLSDRRETSSDRQPLHAVVLLDNSLSMGYESLEGMLLAKAKDRARAYIEKLPPGSKISVVPVCGWREGYSPDPYDTKEGAIEALEQIETVGRSASFVQAVNEAKTALAQAPLLAKRIIFLTDQQQINWRGLEPEQLAELPPIQVVDVAPGEWSNVWIDEFRVQDGLVDVETPATIVAKIEYAGLPARRDVPVRIYLDDSVIGEKLVSLPAGAGSQEVDFQHVFTALPVMPEPDRPVFITLRAAIERDELPADDERHLAVPVVAALPVVFVDALGAEDEEPALLRYGETLRLRKLLAPRATRELSPRQLVKIRHVRPDALRRELLADARLVVVAGLPGIDDTSVSLLRQYVVQGGQLLIAAGGDFSPSAWNAGAWQEGAGILPAPLEPEPLGEVPEVAGDQVRPFFLSFESLAREDYFQLAGLSEVELRDLYAEPFFFKAVAVDVGAEALAQWRAAESRRIRRELELAAEVERLERELGDSLKQDATLPQRRARLEDRRRQLADLRPRWLSWAADSAEEPGVIADERQSLDRIVAALVEESQPRVLAAFDTPGKNPYLVERKIGRGKVVFVASGLTSSWNTLLTTNATVLFDRLMRGMIESTLPRRNFPVLQRLALPLPGDEHDLVVTLSRPRAARPQPLDIGYIGPDRRGITLTDLYERGVYRVTAFRGQPASLDSNRSGVAERPAWEIPLVVGGPGEESDLTPLSRDKLQELTDKTTLRWVGPGEEISLAGAAIRGQSFWWYLTLVVLVCLLVEMGILAWPNMRPAETT
jgi:hypothetical protein